MVLMQGVLCAGRVSILSEIENGNYSFLEEKEYCGCLGLFSRGNKKSKEKLFEDLLGEVENKYGIGLDLNLDIPVALSILEVAELKGSTLDQLRKGGMQLSKHPIKYHSYSLSSPNISKALGKKFPTKYVVPIFNIVVGVICCIIPNQSVKEFGAALISLGIESMKRKDSGTSLARQIAYRALPYKMSLCQNPYFNMDSDSMPKPLADRMNYPLPEAVLEKIDNLMNYGKADL